MYMGIRSRIGCADRDRKIKVAARGVITCFEGAKHDDFVNLSKLFEQPACVRIHAAADPLSIDRFDDDSSQ